MTIVDPLRAAELAHPAHPACPVEPAEPALWSRRARRLLDEAARELEGLAFAALMDPRHADLDLVGLCTRALDSLHALGARSDEAPAGCELPPSRSIARAGRLLLGIDPAVVERPADRARLGRVIADLSAYRAA